MSLPLFAFGTLLDDDLRGTVLGMRAEGTGASLGGCRALGADFGAVCETHPGAQVDGRIYPLDDAARARLSYYAEGLGQAAEVVEVRTAEGVVRALSFGWRSRGEAAGDPWSFDAWRRDQGDLARLVAREAMVHFGRFDAARLRRSIPTIRIRAASALRAASDPMPARVRSAIGRDAIRLEERRLPYVNYFAIDETDLRHSRFDGGESPRITRAALVSGDAVTVLPYDPARDRVMLIEQFRFGPYARGDLRPWSLEPIAGRIDPGETPDEAVRREAREETGLALRELIPIGSYYPSPGAVSEYIFSYLALADLPDGCAGLGGADEEDEDIRAHLLSFDELMELLETGEADNGPLWISALWLARRRAGGKLA